MKTSFAAIGKQIEREHNQRMSLAWHIEALRRSKKMPKLERLLAKQQAARMKQDWQQQMGIMEMWVARTRRIAAADKAKA